MADHHGCVPKLRSSTHALAPTTLLNDIPGHRFSLRLAAGMLPTPELSNRRENIITIPYFPFCCRNVNINDKHLFTTCKRQTN
jgi:hypothetical protein